MDCEVKKTEHRGPKRGNPCDSLSLNRVRGKFKGGT